MYKRYFGFKEEPFSLTPDPRFFYLSRQHREALEHLLYGIEERKGFILITGGVGTGKTTLCRALLERLDESIDTALIFNSFISDMELLEILIDEFSISTDSRPRTKRLFMDALNRFFLENYSRRRNSVILIDEAQNLSHSVLEQIRMLSNLETDKEKLVQIVFFAQREFNDILSSPSLRQLSDRILVRYDLPPLDKRDTKNYIQHRISIAGGNIRFTSSALNLIHKASEGNPRKINAICDRALLVAFASGKETIGKGMVKEAIREIMPQKGVKIRRQRSGPSILFIIVVISLAFFSGWALNNNIFFRIQKFFKPKASINVSHKSTAHRVDPFKRVSLTDNKSMELLLSLSYDQFSNSSKDFRVFSHSFDPQYILRIKRPIRVGIRDSDRFMVIKAISKEHILLVDAKGREFQFNTLSILPKMGSEICWIIPIEDSPFIRRGIRGGIVYEIQKFLKRFGYAVEVSGIYDSLTQKMVMRFQRDMGIEPDGVIGPDTWAIIYLFNGKL